MSAGTNKRKLVVAVAAGLAALIAAAFAVDCVRLASQLRSRVELADADLAKPEERLMTLLSDSPSETPEVRTAVAAYRDAPNFAARRASYGEVVSAFRKTMEGKLDATDPLDRKFMDDVAGAINRRDVAQEPYEQEAAAYRAFLTTLRGTVARCFSQQDTSA